MFVFNAHVVGNEAGYVNIVHMKSLHLLTASVHLKVIILIVALIRLCFKY
jgi:hypothetical protein